MDTISQIIQAITGALGQPDSEENIKKLYELLKADIQKRYDADVSKAIENLEQNPESAKHIKNLKEELIVSVVKKDNALLTLVRTILDTLNPPEDDAELGPSGTVYRGGSTMAGSNNNDENEELVIGE